MFIGRENELTEIKNSLKRHSFQATLNFPVTQNILNSERVFDIFLLNSERVFNSFLLNSERVFCYKTKIMQIESNHPFAQAIGLNEAHALHSSAAFKPMGIQFKIYPFFYAKTKAKIGPFFGDCYMFPIAGVKTKESSKLSSPARKERTKI